MTPKQKTYSLIFLIALGVSLFLYNYVLLENLPQIEITDKLKDNSTRDVTGHIFQDLDYDNIKESLTFNRDSGDKSILYLAIRRESGNYIGQFNFKLTTMRIEWIAYSDLNNDNNKEIIAFYEKQDTIYSTIIDWANDKYLGEDIFVLAKPDTIYADVWAPMLRVIGDIKNPSNEIEIIFSITTGFSQIPRGVFAFNTTLKKVTKKFTIGAAINSVKLFDLNRDGIDEIIINTNSTANNGRLPKMPYYNDFKSWLIVLDNNFDTLFTKNMDIPLNGVQSSYFIGKNENFLISVFSTGSHNNILKINKNGEIKQTIEIEDGGGYFRSTTYHENDHIFLPTNKTLNILDSELRLIEKFYFNSQVYIPYAVNIDSDKKNEYILWKQQGIDILDDDYSIIESDIGTIKFSPPYSSISHSHTNSGIKLHLSSPGKNLRFTIIPNSLYSLRYFFFVIILLVVYLVGLLAHYLLNKSYIFINLLRNTTQKSSMGIILISPNKKLSFINKSTRDILSSKNITISRESNLEEVFYQEKSLGAFLNKAINDVKRAKTEINLSNSKIIEISILPIRTPLGLLLSFYIQIDDLTESLLSDRAKTLAHSIQKVAHEIKTPLSSVLLSLDSLEQNLRNPEKRESLKDDFTVARKEIDRIKKFINSFLKFANMAGTQLQSCSLEELINNALLKFSNYLSNGIEIVLEVNKKIDVIVDSYQIEEVFQVLIENSIDAMHGKGKIIISAIENGKESVTISVKDNGNGIKEEQLPSIFQPYMTTKKDGTGMGLAIAKKILKDHGSEIKVKSKLGKGTEFSLKLKKVE